MVRTDVGGDTSNRSVVASVENGEVRYNHLLRSLVAKWWRSFILVGTSSVNSL